MTKRKWAVDIRTGMVGDRHVDLAQLSGGAVLEKGLPFGTTHAVIALDPGEALVTAWRSDAEGARCKGGRCECPPGEEYPWGESVFPEHRTLRIIKGDFRFLTADEVAAREKAGSSY